jgi:hypothetical protein
VDHLGAGELLEQLARQMLAGAHTRRAEGHRSGIGLEMLDQLRHRRRLEPLRVQDQDVGHDADLDDGGQVLDRAVRHLGTRKDRGDREGGSAGKAQRGAVGWCPGKLADAEHAARPADILDHDRLAPGLVQVLAHHPGEDVGRSSGRERHDQLHGAGRIAGLLGAERGSEEGETGCCHAEAATAKWHGFLR